MIARLTDTIMLPDHDIKLQVEVIYNTNNKDDIFSISISEVSDYEDKCIDIYISEQDFKFLVDVVQKMLDMLKRLKG